MSEQSQGPGWWLASDGLWYPPQDPPPLASAPPQAAIAQPSGPTVTRSSGEKIVLGAAGALIIGSFLPWASAGPFEVSGTDGDGQLTLLLGAVVAALAWTRKAPRVQLVVLLLAAAIGIYDLVDIGRIAGDDNAFFEVSIGIGLWIVVAASIVGVVGWIQHRRSDLA